MVDEYDFVPLALPEHVHVEALLREELVLVSPIEDPVAASGAGM